MTSLPQTHYLNAEFDLSLRQRPRRLAAPALVRQVCELSVQALFGAAEGEAALLRREVPGEFLEQLDACGMALPRLLTHPRIDPGTRLCPFGWSAEAIELNRRHQQPVEHPSLSTIRRVNSRSFAAELEAELGVERPPGAVVGSRAELESFLAGAPAMGEWVIKAEHGNAGMANRRLRSPRLTAADRRFVDGQFAEDDRMVIEGWLPRERDWCFTFYVPFEGSRLRVHEAVYTNQGAVIGALFEPDGGEPPAWPAELGVAARRIATRLQREGYFGPVCADAFSWREGHRAGLRLLADLNCRLPMSDAAHRWWRRLAPERTCYYRFFNRRKLSLATEWAPALAALGDWRYDRARRRGILLASPLDFGKLAVIFVAGSRAEIFALEQSFRARFES